MEVMVGQDGLRLCHLIGADEESQAAMRLQQGGSSGQDLFEAFHCAKRYQVEARGWKGFGAGRLYIDVRQYKGAGDFAQEGCLLVIGLDQREGDLRRPELDWNAGETGA